MREAFLAAAIAVLCSAPSDMDGQSKETQPAFEVASLKPTAVGQEHSWATNGMKGGPGTDDPGRFTATNMNLRSLLSAAYELQSDQIVGSGLDGASFDIVASVPKGSTREQLNQMLAVLLTDRFKLQIHWELREVRGYVLSISTDGPKLKVYPAASAPAETTGEKAGGVDGRRQAPTVYIGYLPDGQTRFVFTAAPISRLVDLIARWSKRPVLDKTGLQGRYDFSLDYTPDGAERSPGDAVGSPSLSAAVQEIGLRLETKRSEVRYLVVDHFEKTPISN